MIARRFLATLLASACLAATASPARAQQLVPSPNAQSPQHRLLGEFVADLRANPGAQTQTQARDEFVRSMADIGFYGYAVTVRVDEAASDRPLLASARTAADTDVVRRFRAAVPHCATPCSVAVNDVVDLDDSHALVRWNESASAGRTISRAVLVTYRVDPQWNRVMLPRDASSALQPPSGDEETDVLIAAYALRARYNPFGLVVSAVSAG